MLPPILKAVKAILDTKADAALGIGDFRTFSVCCGFRGLWVSQLYWSVWIVADETALQLRLSRIPGILSRPLRNSTSPPHLGVKIRLIPPHIAIIRCLRIGSGPV